MQSLNISNAIVSSLVGGVVDVNFENIASRVWSFDLANGAIHSFTGAGVKLSLKSTCDIDDFPVSPIPKTIKM